MYVDRTTEQGTRAQASIVKNLTKLGTSMELRYACAQGIIEPLAKYISTARPEGRSGGKGEAGDDDDGVLLRQLPH